jgi:conjugative coupling factor TraD (TOL family)
MTAKYEVENLLREPFELLSAIACLTSAVFCAVAPHTMLMSASLGYSFAALFGLYGCKRLVQGRNILRYQRHLKTLPRFVMYADKLPISQKGLFLGRGFEWKTKHIERLIATLDSRNERYTSLPAVYRWARSLQYSLEGTRLSWVADILDSNSLFNPIRPKPDVGGRPALHGVGMSEERDQFQTMASREGHTIVVGASGVGKSRVAEIFIAQDIRRGNNIVVVIDPKGDAGLFKRVYSECKRAGRFNQFRALHLAFPEFSCKYNPVGAFSRETEIPGRLTSGLSESGEAKSFKDFVWQFSKFISAALIFIGEKPTYKSIKKSLRSIDELFVHYTLTYLAKHTIDFRERLNQLSASSEKNIPKALKGRSAEAVNLALLVKEMEIYDPMMSDLIYMLEMDRDYYNKLSVQLGPFLEKVTSGRVGAILSPDYSDVNDDRTTLDLIEVFKQGGVVYLGLDALTDPEVATAVGEALFSELTSLAGYFYNFGVDPGNPFEDIPKRSVCIHGDEFSDLIGPKFATLINKSRGVGYELTLYTQTLSDILAKLESDAKAGQIIGNISTLFMMRPQELKTAEILSHRLPEVKVRDHTMVSGYQDQAESMRFLSSNQDRTTESKHLLLSAAEVMALPKGQAFVLSDGSYLRKVRSPLLKDREGDLPASIQSIIDEMSAQYSKTVNWEDVTHGWQI